MILNFLRRLLVVVRVIHNWAETRRCVSDQAIDELLQVGVQVNRLDFLYGRLHVEQEFVHASLEGTLVRSEAHTLG